MCPPRSPRHFMASYPALNVPASTGPVSCPTCHSEGQAVAQEIPLHCALLFLIQIGFWTVPCFSVKQVELSFGGYRFAINSSDFYLGRVSASSTDCVGGVLSMGNGLPSNLAIIGDEFLKSCEFLSGVDVFGFVFTPFIV